MDKTIDELRADLAAAESECRAAYKAYHAIRVGGSDFWEIDKRHAWERYDDAVVARDLAEALLWGVLDGVPA